MTSITKEIKTVNKKFVGRFPDFKGKDVAVWTNTDKNGNKYLAIKFADMAAVNAFPPLKVVLPTSAPAEAVESKWRKDNHGLAYIGAVVA